MMDLLGWPRPVWSHTSTDYVKYGWEEVDDKIIIKVELPGKKKEDLEIKFKPTGRCINISVKETGREYNLDLSRNIEPDETKAKLEDGVLIIEAPFKHKDKTIRIE